MKKMYVIVRRDLSVAYRCVQGAHALARYAIVYPRRFKNWNNQVLIFLDVQNLIEMKELETIVHKNKIPYVSFFEPDLDDQVTALAFRECHLTGSLMDYISTLRLTY